MRTIQKIHLWSTRRRRERVPFYVAFPIGVMTSANGIRLEVGRTQPGPVNADSRQRNDKQTTNRKPDEKWSERRTMKTMLEQTRKHGANEIDRTKCYSYVFERLDEGIPEMARSDAKDAAATARTTPRLEWELSSRTMLRLPTETLRLHCRITSYCFRCDLFIVGANFAWPSLGEKRWNEHTSSPPPQN